MLIHKLIEQMIGDQSGEFEYLPVMLSLETAERVRDLAHKLGVPSGRLLTELVGNTISEAETEWRRIAVEKPPQAITHASTFQLSLRPPQRIK